MRTISKDFIKTKSRYKQSNKKRPLPCSHGLTRDDLVQKCIDDFKRLLRFKNTLRKNIEYEPSQNDILVSMIKALARDRADDARSYALFKDSDAIKRILGDPLIEIVESPDELRKETLRVSTSKVPDELNLVPKEREIYNTKQFVTLSTRA